MGLMFSIREFCESHRISRSQFYKLLADGTGPAVTKIGRKSLISAESAAEWRERMSNRPLKRRVVGTIGTRQRVIYEAGGRDDD